MRSKTDSGSRVRLLAWYRERRRALPWRVDPTPYRVWLSEAMLQQTQVRTVIPYFERFVARFPTLADLARAGEDEVLALWSGLGYYSRARALHRAAGQILERHRGEFPRELDQALALPGVGRYTAAAVLSIAHGLPHAVVDGNVERVIARVHRIAGPVKSGAGARRIAAIAGAWLDRDLPGDFNQALMELGATICTPLRPACAECPIADSCAARRHGDIERYPEAPPKRATVALDLEVGIVEQSGALLLERPDELGFLRGLWVFPLADVTDGGRGIRERLGPELGVELRDIAELPPLRHAITYRRIRLLPCRLAAEPFAIDETRFRWARRDELGASIAVSSICKKVLARMDGEG